MAVTESPEYKKFRSTLSDLLSPVNETRTKAEEIYDGIPPSEKVFLLMAAIGAEGLPPEESQLAAILLRRLFSSDFDGVFSKITPEAQQQIKTHLLQLVRQDIESNLRRKISDVISELARNLIDGDGNNHWPEFMAFLFEAVSSPDPKLKEIALLMFASVPSIFGNQEDKYLGVIHHMLVQSLTDQASVDVRFAAVEATSSFLLAHEKETTGVHKKFSDCLNLLLQFLAQVLESTDERIDDVLRYLIDLVDKCPQSFRSQVDILFQLCLKCISTPTYAESTRHLTLEVLITLAESAPAMVRKLCSKHIPSLIAVLFKMMTDLEDDPDWDFDEESNEEESDSNNIVAEAALDRLALALGGKTILPIVLNSLSHLLNDADWKCRHAGLMTISAVGEGCHKQMSDMLPQIVEGVLPFLMDSHSRVRYAACNALGQMASDFAPVFQKKFTEKVLNGLLQLLVEPSSPRVQAHAGAALVNFFEDCPKNVLAPHMDCVANRLESVLSSKLNEFIQKGKTNPCLEQVVVTIASLSDSAEEKFIQYYDKFMPMLKYILQNTNQPELKLLRGKTIECISLIGLAVGKEKFLNDAGEVMDLLLKSQTGEPLREDDPQLSYMIATWARICKILGKGFEPYLPYVLEPVLKAAALKPEVAVLDADDMKVVEEDDDWEFVNLGEKRNFGIRTAGLEEKATACEMLVCYARELKEGFAPYVEETVKLVVPMLQFYFHDGVRSSAAEILPHLLEASKIRGDSYVQEMWRFILTPFLKALESEPEPDVLCEEIGAFAQCIEVLNTRCFSHEEMMFLINLINKKLLEHFEKAHAREQQRKTEDYDDVLEETLERQDDDDVYILCKISDVVSTLFSTYKQDFFPYFDILLPQYIKLLEPSRPSADRLWALSVFADVIEYGGPSCSKYQQYFLQPLLESLAGECPDLRQTAAYCIGCLGRYGGPEFAKVCSDSIPLLVKMIVDPESRSEDNIKATENAISAVAKFLMCNNSMINMEEMLPLWVSWLPIWEDTEEASFVYNFICSLLESNNPLLLGNDNCNVPHIVKIFAEAFSREAMDATSDVGKRVVALIRDIQNNQDLFSVCLQVLNQSQQEALHAALTQS